MGLYAGSVRDPNAADASHMSLSPSDSSGSGNAEARDRDGEVPMEVDAVETVKAQSPERSRLLLSTTVVDGGPDEAEDVYDYGTWLVACFLFTLIVCRVQQKQVSPYTHTTV